ncbi:hypothetical protein EJ08DRAFT_658485 [Tothia fuscella]|uniref:Uncharacterized protein n=1 Tax=Tothia fuscella TaxID=1048955 RepID=A0A9P4U061_9PEZI|nr:hypothetical protein EJ08DRAFT_658485 [Tothia fuscella]
MASSIHPANITVPIMTLAHGDASPQISTLTSDPPQQPPPQLPHNPSFEDEISTSLLSAPIVPTSTSLSNNEETPTIPHIPPHQLPLPLSSPLRTYHLPQTNIHLTQKLGSIYGGPGLPHPAIIEAGQRLIEENGFTSQERLEDWVHRRIASLVREAERRAEGRVDARRGNERVREEIRVLEGDYEMERRAVERRLGGGGVR